jgi:succinylglutamate desuccinylase
MVENISDTAYIWMAVNSIEKEMETLRSKLKEYEGDDKCWHSFETVQAIVKERDELQSKLDDAIYNFKRIKNSPRGMVGEDWFKMVANDALKKIEE